MTPEPGFHRRRIGDLTVTAIYDGVVGIPLEACTNIALDDARRLQNLDGRAYPPKLHTSIFAVSRGDTTVLIDAGGAPNLDKELGLARSDMRAAGIDPISVSAVLLTHLHTDHYGGLARDDGSAAFPGAELIVHADDYRFRFSGGEPPPDYMQRALHPYRDRLRLIEGGSVLPGIEAIPLPGHTPGHTGYMVVSGSERLLIWGDVVHLPAIQFGHPGVSMSYDVDPEQSETSRRQIFRRAVDEGLLVAGMHMDFPCFGRVTPRSDTYEWTSEPL